MLEGMDELVCSTGCTKQCHIYPLISWIFISFIWVGLAWHGIGIYYSAISAFWEPHHHYHKASSHPIISKLMCQFFLTPLGLK